MRLVWLAGRPSVWEQRWWSPVGALLAQLMRGAGMSETTGGQWRRDLWWFHGLLALLFIALIPFTKVKHIFTAAGSLMLRDPLAAQRLSRVPPSRNAPARSSSPISTGSSCSISTPAPSAAAATRPARRAQPARRCRRAM
jgi:hypothetical protein